MKRNFQISLGLTLVMFAMMLASVARSDERILPYIDWIVENSELEYNGQALPTVKHVSQEVLQIYYYGGFKVAQAERNGVELPELGAVYLHETDEILINKSGAPASTIVHELTHYLQDINGHFERTDCLPELEMPAYQVEAKWAIENGIEPPNMLMAVILAMQCRDHHPAR